MPGKNSFSKEERLRGKKNFEDLISHGHSFFIFPFKVCYKVNLVNTDQALVEVILPRGEIGISIPKRRFKRAVDRNLLKRRIRETYRTLKNDAFCPYLLQNQITVKMLFIYSHHVVLDYAVIYQKVGLILRKITHAHRSTLQ